MFSGCPSVAVHTAAALCTFEPPTLWYTFYDSVVYFAQVAILLQFWGSNISETVRVRGPKFGAMLDRVFQDSINCINAR